MLSQPQKWNNHSFGGYLLNNIHREDLITGANLHAHKIENREILHNAINNMSSIKFNFNTDLISFIEKDGKFLSDLIYDQQLSDSEKYQNYMYIKIGKIFNKQPFYIPLQADWRGRIYTKSFFANYQGGDLALSLIEFNEGQSLTEKGKDYLYIYGCNLYNENNMSRSSYENRINWVKSNIENILSMKKDFILKAENKFCFVSFCLVMRELNKNPNYAVKLPIFLDATCSGIQHLAALIKDKDLAEEVNLAPKNESDVPADIYNTLVDPINDAIHAKGEEDSKYNKLKLVKLSRNDVKHPIMTRTYNVTVMGVKDQLISKFKNNSSKDSKLVNVPSINEGETVSLNVSELFQVASIIHNSIFKKYPGLNFVYDYFINMTKALNKLNIPVIWLTPAGLEITQLYYKVDKVKLGISLGGKRSVFVLNKLTDDIDKLKQRGAIIPNVIHSMDATHLMNVINTAFKSNINQVITVHDCFGTHPNNMENLFDIVKDEFIKIYLNEDFINKFHDRNIQSIKDYGYKLQVNNINNNLFIQNDDNNEIINIPKKPVLGTFDLNDISKSRYMIT